MKLNLLYEVRNIVEYVFVLSIISIKYIKRFRITYHIRALVQIFYLGKLVIHITVTIHPVRD